MEPEVGCPLAVRHDFYMMHLSSGLAAGYTGVSQSSDSWFPCEIPIFEWLYPNHPIHNLHHIISYLQRVKFPKYLTIIPLFMRHLLSSYEYHIQWIPMEHRWNFPILSLLSYMFPILPGVSPGFLGGNRGCSLVPRVLSQEFDLPPALRQGLQLLKVDAAVAVAVQAAEQQALLGQRQPIHGHLR